MNYSLLLLAVVGAVIVDMASASKCDDTVISGIKTIWGSSVPSGLLTKAFTEGEKVVVATTAGYFPTGTKCVTSKFTDASTVEVTITPETGTASTKTYKLEESSGTTYSAGSTTIMYHISDASGVKALYRCTKDGSAGAAEGVIKVSSGYDKAALTKAKEVLKGLKIDLSKEYPEKC